MLKAPNTISKFVPVHTLVIEAFIGPRPDKMVVNHKDGNKKNSNMNNLEYITQSQNRIHALKNNLVKQCRTKKLKEIDIPLIRKMYEKNIKVKQIAEVFEVTSPAITAVIRGKTYSHIL
jgi:hypothetical protein